MKLAILSLALLILGCGNKPKSNDYGPPVAIWGNDYQCPSDYHPVVRKLSGMELATCDKNLATPAQWEAAQGLYNPKRFENEVDDPQYDMPRHLR